MPGTLHLGPIVLPRGQEIPDVVCLLHRVLFLVGDSSSISPSPPLPSLLLFPFSLTSFSSSSIPFPFPSSPHLLCLSWLDTSLPAPKTIHSEMDQKAKGLEKVKATEKRARWSKGICLCCHDSIPGRHHLRGIQILSFTKRRKRRVFLFLLHLLLKIAS